MTTAMAAPRPAYLTTVATQILMCFGVYLSFNLGSPQHNRPFYYYFISVNGGFRPPLHHSLLLQQMENAVRSFDAQFVLTITQLGQQDPLLQNSTSNFQYLRIPWYATKLSVQNQSGRLSKQMKLPSGRSLDIIVLGFDISKEEDALHIPKSNQFEELKRALEATDSDWKIVVGLNPLDSCYGSKDPEVIKEVHKHVRAMLARYRVNAYLSGNGCEDYAEREGVAYMSHPAPTAKGSYGTSGEASDGFLLHKVGLLEIVGIQKPNCHILARLPLSLHKIFLLIWQETYSVNLNAEVVRKTAVHKRAHEAI